MIHGSLLALLLLFSLTGLSGADVKLGKQTDVVFATVDEGRSILGRQDDFVQRMSPFDRQARMHTDQPVSQQQFLALAARSVLSWTPDETASVEAALQAVEARLMELCPKLPGKIYVIKTTGAEEGGAAYTRSTAIVLPQSELHLSQAHLQKLLAHELFHILTRSHPALRDRLYATIGFEPCPEIEFPSALKPRKITNPDAPRNDHYIRVSLGGQTVRVVPILFSRTEKYDVGTGREFFAYLRFQLLVLEEDTGGKKRRSVGHQPQVGRGRDPQLVGVRDVSGFFEQVGRNTGYIIHPEEILADNFALLVVGQQDVPSPEILQRLREVLSKEKQRPELEAPAGGPDAQRSARP
jgi:hypothetical protein